MSFISDDLRDVTQAGRCEACPGPLGQNETSGYSSWMLSSESISAACACPEPRLRLCVSLPFRMNSCLALIQV